jgi:peptidase M50-like protein
LSAPFGDLDAFVRSRFEVGDSFMIPEGGAEYKVAYGDGTRDAFVEARDRLAREGYTPYLTGTKEDCTLLVRKTVPQKSSFPRLAAVLKFVFLSSIVVFAVLEAVIYQSFAPAIAPIFVLVSYGAAIAAVVAAHEFGRWFVSRRLREKRPTSYVIPGIPNLTSFLPVIGIASSQRGEAVNKDRLFDIMLWGPLLTFVASLALYFVGEFTAVQSAVQLKGNLLVSANITASEINPSLIQYAVGFLTGPLTPSTPAGYVGLSPVADAATVGFFLTFVGFLPMASFDGGALSALALGTRAWRVLTYVSVFLLISLDTPNYWVIGIVVLLLTGREPTFRTLDQVSDITSRKKWVFAAAIVLAFLCLPIPSTFATIPLG